MTAPDDATYLAELLTADVREAKLVGWARERLAQLRGEVSRLVIERDEAREQAALARGQSSHEHATAPRVVATWGDEGELGLPPDARVAFVATDAAKVYAVEVFLQGGQVVAETEATRLAVVTTDSAYAVVLRPEGDW